MEATQIHADLIEACKRGRRDAQFELYKLYSKAMYNTALRMLQNAHDAEDMLQSAFLEVFAKLDTFRFESSLGSWIKRILINKCINHLKSQKIALAPLAHSEYRLEDSPSGDEEPPYTVEKVRRAIERLPDGYRIVFSLYAIEGYDHEEIAHILNISESASKSQYSRAKARLREMIAAD
ncbi:MAG: RNA polymerase sigma factor [Saprospiraceae bacterium]